MRVSARDLSHSFPGTGELFGNLSVDFSSGEMVGVIGPSGSGKSTLLSLMAGWEQPLSGTVLWDGIRSVAWVFQNPYGVAGRSAIDHVVLPLLVRGYRRREALTQAQEIMDRFRLGHVAHRRYGDLSGGEAQRLMLARAIAKAADLLLVDEPTAQLDPHASSTVNGVLSELADKETIVVVATHDPDTAHACTRVLDLGLQKDLQHD